MNDVLFRLYASVIWPSKSEVERFHSPVLIPKTGVSDPNYRTDTEGTVSDEQLTRTVIL